MDMANGCELLKQLRADGNSIAASGAMTAGLMGASQHVRQSVNESEASASFVIVTRPRGNPVNRNGNAVQIMQSEQGGGLQTTNYEQNPVVLWDHGFGHYQFPIARAAGPGGLELKKQATKATSTAFFDQSSEFAMDVFRLVNEDIIKMASIGFRPLKGIRLMADERRQADTAVRDFEGQRRNWDITESELQEWSVVNIGADRGALRQRLEHGSVGGESMGWTTQEIMRQFAEEKPAIGCGLPDELRTRLTQAAELMADVVVSAVLGVLPENLDDSDDEVETQAAVDPDDDGEDMLADDEKTQAVTETPEVRSKATELASDVILQHVAQRFAEINQRLSTLAIKMGGRS